MRDEVWKIIVQIRSTHGRHWTVLLGVLSEQGQIKWIGEVHWFCQKFHMGFRLKRPYGLPRPHSDSESGNPLLPQIRWGFPHQGDSNQESLCPLCHIHIHLPLQNNNQGASTLFMATYNPQLSIPEVPPSAPVSPPNSPRSELWTTKNNSALVQIIPLSPVFVEFSTSPRFPRRNSDSARGALLVRSHLMELGERQGLEGKTWREVGAFVYLD